MKQGTLTSRIVMLALLTAIVVYLGVYAWNAFTEPFSTVLSYSYTVDDVLEATGFLVRSETVIPSTGALVDLTRTEGEKVAKGADVAITYQSSAAADRRQQIHALELELEQLQYSLSGSDDRRDSAKLSQDIIDATVSLRASVAEGDLTRLEDQTMLLKSLVYKRDITYGDDFDSTVAIQASIQAVTSQLAELRNQAALDTGRVTVDKPGTFSCQADGYETLLTPELLTTLTPTALDELANQKVSGDSTAIGKLITDATWYFVCPVPETDAKRFVEGRTVAVRFSRDWSGEVEMKVERVGAVENGQIPLILSTNRFLAETTLLRRQTVDLVFSSKAGIRVPKSAIRVLTLEEENEETGVVTETKVTGVFALVGNMAEFKPVEVVDQRDDYCIVVAIQPKQERKILRAGDQIIVAAERLFDGQVVR